MQWQTDDNSLHGNTYTITVEATAYCSCTSQSISYVLTLIEACNGITLTIADSAFVSPLIDYTVGSGDKDVTWTSSAVTTSKPSSADCGNLSWNIIDTDTNSEPDPNLFFIDTEVKLISVNTDDVSLMKTYNLQV